MSSEHLKYQFVDPKILDERSEKLHTAKRDFVQVGEKKWFLPGRYTEFAERCHSFKLRPDDVFIVTFPRSGTTWTQELVWLVANNLDYKSAGESLLRNRSPLFERDIVRPADWNEWFVETNKDDPLMKKSANVIGKSFDEILDEMQSPRVIKFHLPLSLIPSVLEAGGKIVYVARNPKDVAASCYHYRKSETEYKGDFATYWDFFERNLVIFTPQLEHIKEAWALRHRPNMLFLFFEELKMDLPDVIRRVARFLEKPLTEEQILELADHLDIKNFRNNRTVNKSEYIDRGILKGSHIRKGQIGGWKDEFTPELEARADKWIEDNLKDTDLAFPYLDNKRK